MANAALETVAFGALAAVALFASAGTLAWPAAWIVLAAYAVYAIVGFLILPRDLVEERSRLPAGTKGADLVIAGLAAFFLFPALFVACGLDMRLRWSPPLPAWLRFLALAGFVLGNAFALWAARVNRFFSSVVRVQSERGHHVVTSGPYAFVRHPGYAGSIAAYLVLPLALGSLAGLAPALIGSAFLALRIRYEESVLSSDLPGYREYAQRVVWRLLPGVW